MIQPMRTRGGVFGVAMVAGLILLFPGAVSAGPAPPPPAVTITADDSCCEFDLDFYGQSRGEVATFENPAGADAPHNVVSTVRGPDGGPLFRSETIAAGSTSPVEGTQYLDDGLYPFYCTLHGSGMSGELEISPLGVALPRPAVKAVIAPQSLRGIRRSGIVRVSLRAVTGSPAVNLELKSGPLAAAYAGGIKLGSGSTRVVSLKLNRAGRKAVSKGRQAVISVRASVAFGSPASAKRTVR